MSTRSSRKTSTSKRGKKEEKTLPREKVVADDRCNYFVKGVRCPRRLTEKKYCLLHERINHKPAAPISVECPICAHTYEKLRWFECSHGCCTVCVSRFTNTICPFCRKELVLEFTTTERKQIEKNYNKKLREDADDRNRTNRIAINNLVDDAPSSSESESWERDVREFAQQQRYLYPPPMFASFPPFVRNLTPIVS